MCEKDFTVQVLKCGIHIVHSYYLICLKKPSYSKDLELYKIWNFEIVSNITLSNLVCYTLEYFRDIYIDIYTYIRIYIYVYIYIFST